MTNGLPPPEIITPLGNFDLDPCTLEDRPWDTAKAHFFLPKFDGLKERWFGRVWMNPPYGREVVEWMKLMAEHNDGICLTFARTDVKWFHKYVFGVATGILFLKGRLSFYNKDGIAPNSNAGGPSCLIAYGKYNFDVLKNCSIGGYCVEI